MAWTAAVRIIGTVLKLQKRGDQPKFRKRLSISKGTESGSYTATIAVQVWMEPAPIEGRQLNRWTPSLNTPCARAVTAAASLRTSMLAAVVCSMMGMGVGMVFGTPTNTNNARCYNRLDLGVDRPTFAILLAFLTTPWMEVTFLAGETGGSGMSPGSA